MKMPNNNNSSLLTPRKFLSSMSQKRVNIDEPRWDQSTYWGRARHFLVTTDPRNVLCSNAELDNAENIVKRYRYVPRPLLTSSLV
jgi:hypothetical protein